MGRYSLGKAVGTTDKGTSSRSTPIATEGLAFDAAVGENPKNLAGEVTATLGSDVFNPQNLKRINAIIGSIANMEYILPEHAVARLRGSLDKIHLTFPQVPTMEGSSGEFDLPLTLFGGRFGKTGTEAPDEVTNDDGISHMVEG